MSRNYSLAWQSFSEHFRVLFRSLYEDQRYSDVTLVSGDQTQFKAHKIVLRACSPVFRKIIDNNPCQHPLIYLRGIQSYDMESILQFMYLGEGRCYYERIEEFIKVSKNLEVKEISNGAELDIEEQDIKREDVLDDEEKMTDEDPKQILEKKIRKRQPRNHVTSDAKSCLCPECGKLFSKNSKMLTHYRSKHAGNSKHEETNKCDYEAKSKIHLTDICNDVENIIEETVTNNEAEKRTDVEQSIDFKSTECPKCRKVFCQKGNLRTHYRAVHEGIKYPCNQCDYQATQKGDLQIHIQAIHESIKYPCAQCDYQATRQSHLQQHIQSQHEGIRYLCNQCDYLASTRSSLRAHIRSKHEGKKYSCVQCDYQCSQKYKLKTHVKSKHEDQKYPCNQCDYKATKKVDINRHIRTRHA